MTESELVQHLLAELQRTNAGPDDARTVVEWMPSLGVRDEKTARKQIRVLLDAGKMEHTHVIRPRMDGLSRTVNAYRLTVGDQ